MLYHIQKQPVEVRKTTLDTLVISSSRDVIKALSEAHILGKDVKIRFARKGEYFKTLKNMTPEQFNDNLHMDIKFEGIIIETIEKHFSKQVVNKYFKK